MSNILKKSNTPGTTSFDGTPKSDNNTLSLKSTITSQSGAHPAAVSPTSRNDNSYSRKFSSVDYDEFKLDVATLMSILGDPNLSLDAQAVDLASLHSIQFLENLVKTAQKLALSSESKKLTADHFVAALRGDPRKYNRCKEALANYRAMNQAMHAYDDSKYI